jgi:glutaconate CoA-transferase subunit B
MNVRRAIMRASVSDENRPAIAPYAREELLACVIARLIAQLGNEARHVAVGAASPIPAAGALLLKQKRRELRLSFLHKRRGNPFTEGSRELFDLAGQGRIDVFFLGGAQIDGEANINLVRAERRRFPGSFGSAFMYSVVRNVILFREEHSRRVLVPKVEFISAAGNPAALLTGKALFSWQREKRRFRLESVHEPGDIRSETGFSYDSPASVAPTPPPSAEDLALLRGPVAREMAGNYPDFAKRVWGLTS